MNRVRPPLLAVVLLIGATELAAALPPPRDLDWPCQQIKVPTLSLAAVWAGPPIDPAQIAWQQDPRVSALVQRLAQRRVPIEQANKELQAFAQQADGQKQPRLLATMAGLFSLLNQERDSVLAGLDRFGQRQKILAAEIRQDNEKLQALQNQPKADANLVQQLTTQVTLEEQMFLDRRQAVTYACDVPGKVEQRLFALAQTIQQQLQ